MNLKELLRNRQLRRLLLAGVVVVGGWLAQQSGIDLSALGGARSNAAPEVAAPRSAPSARSGSEDDVERIARAAKARESGFMVTVDAEVVKVLPDDNEGSRHQRFLIELPDRRTLLVAHNIDLAERVPLREADRVRVRGQYEWNERGGVLHWTHHDPAGRHPGGWIEHAGERVE